MVLSRLSRETTLTTDYDAQRVREFYRRAGRLDLANRLRERIESEVKTYTHPYTLFQNWYGYESVLGMIIEELEEALNGNR